MSYNSSRCATSNISMTWITCEVTVDLPEGRTAQDGGKGTDLQASKSKLHCLGAELIMWVFESTKHSNMYYGENNCLGCSLDTVFPAWVKNSQDPVFPGLFLSTDLNKSKGRMISNLSWSIDLTLGGEINPYCNAYFHVFTYQTDFGRLIKPFSVLSYTSILPLSFCFLALSA